jgi:hypothetical protein
MRGGGNVGAMLTQLVFLHNSKYSIEDGITRNHDTRMYAARDPEPLPAMGRDVVWSDTGIHSQRLLTKVGGVSMSNKRITTLRV